MHLTAQKNLLPLFCTDAHINVSNRTQYITELKQIVSIVLKKIEKPDL